MYKDTVMKYYFEDQGKQDSLLKVLESWRGTPWRHRMAVKQRGVDCIYFVAAVLEELGILELGKINFPDYSRDWNLHQTRQLLYEGIKEALMVEEVGFDSPMNGDIMLYNYGKAAAHASIYFNELIYQSITKVGVCATYWKEPQWWKRKTFNLRVLS